MNNDNDPDIRPSMGQLLHFLTKYFSGEEIRDIYFELDVDYDDLRGETKSEKSRELLIHLKKLSRIRQLLEVIMAKRPHIDWADVEDFLDEPENQQVGNLLAETYYFGLLPPHIVDRTDHLAWLEKTILGEQQLSSEPAPSLNITVLQGMVGSGKSVLAQIFAKRKKTRMEFFDGIFWLEVGLREKSLELLKKVGTGVGHDISEYSDTEIAIASLRKVLPGKAVLIVLDDIWDHKMVEPFQAILEGNRSAHLLVTTRSKSVGKMLAATFREVGMLNPKQAEEMLQKWAGREDEDFPTVARELGYLPLALKLTGARLSMDKNLTGKQWLKYFNAVEFQKIEGSEARNENLVRSIEVGVDALFGNEAENIPDQDPNPKLLYYSLGIFREDLAIPMDVVFRLWTSIDSRLGEGQCREIIANMQTLALIDIEETDEMIRLHDLLHNYNKEQLKKLGKLEETHNKFLESYNPGFEAPWYSIEGDSNYIFYQLPHHMIEAGRKEELLELFTTAPEWLKGERNNKHEILLLNIWEDVYQKEHDLEEQRIFLKKWLASGRAPKGAKYSGKCVAVLCAYQAKIAEILCIALRHKEKPVSDIAEVYTYYWYQRDPDVGLTILRDLADNITTFKVPRPARIGTLGELTFYLIFHEYNQSYENIDQINNNASEIGDIAISATRQALFLNSPIFRFVIIPARKRIRSLGVYMIKQLLKREGYQDLEAMDTSANLLELEYLFLKLNDRKTLSRGIFPYLVNRDHGDLLSDFTVEQLAACWDGTIADWFSVEYAMVVHGAADPDRLLPILKELFYQGEPPNDNWQFNMLDGWKHVLVMQPKHKIKDSWMEAAREMWSYYYDQLEGEYGYYWTDLVRKKQTRPYYTYHPLSLYAQIWNRWKPDVPVDLLNKYLKRADDAKDDDEGTGLLQHILTGFVDPRITFTNYCILAEHFVKYLKSDDENIRDITIQVFGLCRARDPEAIDKFMLREVRDPNLIEQIVENSHTFSPYSIALTFAYFLLPFLAFSPVENLSRLYGDLDEIMDSGGTGEALGIIVDGLFDTLFVTD